MSTFDSAPCPCCHRSCEIIESGDRRTECNGCGTIHRLAPAPKPTAPPKPKLPLPKKFVPRGDHEGSD